MLIVISDLHLSDGTSSYNISHRAFSHFFDYIKRSLRKEYKELIVVFAGDTFDLLRSDYWLNVYDAEKPRGDLPKDSRQYAVSSKQQNKESHLKNILNNILETNKTSLEIIKQADTLFPIPIKKIIIPGNHDRMMEEIHDYGDILKNALGDVTILKGPHSNEDYGVLIRHGHEYDEYNFEADGIPIGDVNTVELFVRLPFEIKAKFPELENELKSAEDIRPQWRIFDYLQSTYVEMDIKSYIENVVEKTIDNYFAIPYVKEWIEEHDTLSPLDAADKLEYMLYLSKLLPMDWAEKLLKIFSYFETKEPHYEEMAEKEKALYVAYGHTHNENVSFLGVDKRL
jgi:UDP-2,3-diacylglucosamine pyrophosphatase LpxH